MHWTQIHTRLVNTFFVFLITTIDEACRYNKELVLNMLQAILCIVMKDENILLCIVQKVVPCIAVNLRFFLLWFTFKEYIPFSFTTLVVYKLSSVNWYCKRCYNYFLHLLMIFVINILEMWRVFMFITEFEKVTLFSHNGIMISME